MTGFTNSERAETRYSFTGGKAHDRIGAIVELRKPTADLSILQKRIEESQPRIVAHELARRARENAEAISGVWDEAHAEQAFRLGAAAVNGEQSAA